MNKNSTLAGLLYAAVLAASIFVFSACDNLLASIDVKETDIKYEKYYSRFYPLSARGKEVPCFILKSVAEKEDFIELSKEGYFNLNDFMDITDLQKRWETEMEPWLISFFSKYNDNFFKDFNLVMILVGGSGSTAHKVRKISVKNNELNIVIRESPPGLGYIGIFDFVSRNILIPIKRKDFNGNKINIEVRNTRL